VKLSGPAFCSLFRHGQDGIDGDILGYALRAKELQLTKEEGSENENRMRKPIHGHHDMPFYCVKEPQGTT
jgi:hypothetical protein